MAITYTWDCKTVDVKTVKNKKDTVFNVHWRIIGSDDKNSASVYGTIALDTSNLTNFVPFKDLTNEKITSWVESALGEDAVAEQKVVVADALSELETPLEQTKTIGG